MKARYNPLSTAQSRAVKKEIALQLQQLVMKEREYDDLRILALSCIDLNERPRDRYGKKRLNEHVVGVMKQGKDFDRWDDIADEMLERKVRQLCVIVLADELKRRREEINAMLNGEE